MRASDRLVAQATRRSGASLAVLVTGTLGGTAAQLLLPYLLGRTIDALTGGDVSRSAYSWPYGWLLACAAVVAGVVTCEALEVWAGGRASAEASAWLRRTIVRQILGAGTAATRRFTRGDLTTRIGMNAEELGRAPEAIVSAAALLVPTAGSLIALALIDVALLLALLVGLAATSLVLRRFLRDTIGYARRYQQLQGDIAARLTDALAGIRTIAAAGTVRLEVRRVLTPLPDLRAGGMGLWRANARAGVRAGLVVPVVEVAVLAAGGWRLASGDLTLGQLYSAARYAVLGAGLSGALGQIGQLARARAASDRVAELLGQPVMGYGTRGLPTGPASSAGRGTLEFRGVGLTVPGLPGLNGIDLVVPGGRMTVVVGRSGAGKSLLAALAGRLVDPWDGVVLLDGVPLPELDGVELRRAIGYAFERPVLVGSTLEDAIALGMAVPDPEAVRAAARIARADVFVRHLPRGYATGLEAAPMSGGERQRIGLARAIAQAERVLILDDATSSLDTVTERQVSDAIVAGLRGRTRLVVAHRLTTALRADQVVWLDGGRVRAYGPHRVLWRDPEYRRVFQGEPEADAAASLSGGAVQAEESMSWPPS